MKYLIDCDADPFVPEGLEVENHTRMGQVEWDPQKVQLFRLEPQKQGHCLGGYEIHETVKSLKAFNANMLEFLLANSHLIPEEWKLISKNSQPTVLFWGTLYRVKGKDLTMVRGISYFNGNNAWLPEKKGLWY